MSPAVCRVPLIGKRMLSNKYATSAAASVLRCRKPSATASVFRCRKAPALWPADR
jgi:hypothetical protein